MLTCPRDSGVWIVLVVPHFCATPPAGDMLLPEEAPKTLTASETSSRNSKYGLTDMKPGYVRADYPILKTHPRKQKGEEKPKFRKDKDKKLFQKAFWVDSASDSSRLKLRMRLQTCA
ncbi:hypothetical protein MA16_Dca016568 [Dendrobium catenatum]|uniref:Uncharacterized protein n=1 Tax=Dendrobium catenatum TaxID=906689 RepID=A0A2I0VPC5_9ASPA|nr:hypothetical protein MA16_Dca016568 [Dendrobium catenatum]